MLRRQSFPPDPMSFLSGAGEMATRIRERDWSNHPFGPVEQWPQSLRAALGICLNSAFPSAIYWGSDLRLLYNDAWAPIPGPRHPASLGAPAHEVWSDIWRVIEPQFAEMIASGKGLFLEDQMLPMCRFGVPEETYWSYSFTPIRGESGAIEGVFNSGFETTRHVLSRRQMRFLLDLTEAFRGAPGASTVRQMALAMLGTHLGVSAARFCERSGDADTEFAIVETWYAPAGSAPQATVDALGHWAVEQLESGRSIRIDDAARDARLSGARSALPGADVCALVAVPLLEDGRLVALLELYATAPRTWRDIDVDTAREVLSRTVALVERERAAERERIMMREIDHRARNALSVVQSVVRLTLADDLPDFRDKIEDRISALARTHSLLANERWRAVDLAVLVREELAPYATADDERVRSGGPKIAMKPEQARTMAMLLHELATNAAKHGALARVEGELDVHWWVSGGGGSLVLDWIERVPPGSAVVDRPQRSGFGSILLHRVVEEQLGGRVERTFRSTGMECRLTIPWQSADSET